MEETSNQALLIKHPVVTVSPRVKRELESRQFASTS